ncbi:sulfatase [Vallitalea longa]|uniref:Sulfatase n=1 Tax=Vallitalea longa TaxID=2936439 RepID=A0A9W5YAZ7_9FIRM|nr:sulfatase-like hydrolase/transferase [Vallitalea longa]GKX29361.1 sulfatase [Vallitalea longa]
MQHEKPNVLILMTDQQATWSISAYGKHEVDTPNIDRLAKEGIRFEQCYTPSAVCTPSRGCFFTGRYPHSNGAYRNDIPLNLDEITFAQVLKDSGYKTGYIGKWHLNGGDSPGWLTKETSMGFEDCRYMFNSGHFKKMIEQENNINPIKVKNTQKIVTPISDMSDVGNEESYTTDWITNKAIDRIKRVKEQPFCYIVSYPDPHQPYVVREPYSSMYNPEEMSVPDSFYEECLPDWAENDTWGRHRYFNIDLEDRVNRLKKIKAMYCGEVKCIDDNIGRLLDTLEKNGQLDNTIIVFTTDHGDYMGEHGLLEKNNLYDSVYHLPLIMRWKEKLQPGRTIKEFFNFIDFQPTLLSMIGVECSGREQGKDLSSLIIDGVKKTDYVNEAFIHPSDVPRGGIITPEYELAYVGKGFEKNPQRVFADHILFDRKRDPNQLKNLFDDPEYEDIKKELTGMIKKHFKQYGVNSELLPDQLKY